MQIPLAHRLPYAEEHILINLSALKDAEEEREALHKLKKNIFSMNKVLWVLYHDYLTD